MVSARDAAGLASGEVDAGGGVCGFVEAAAGKGFRVGECAGGVLSSVEL